MIYLVYSSDSASSSAKKAGEIKVFSRGWKQLELFASAKPETVIFMRPDDAGLRDLLGSITSMGIRHIVDIRDVPYLNFKDSTRDKFFQALGEMKIDYQGVHAVIHAAGVSSLTPVLERSQGSDAGPSGRFDSFLRARIENGPTMVFCDLDPKEDLKVGSLLKYLSENDFRHAPVLALRERERDQRTSLKETS